MKTLSSGMLSHINNDTTTLCTCWKITRIDGTIISYTDHDMDIVFGGVTYAASDTYTRTAIKSDLTLAVDNMEVTSFLDNDSITSEDIETGKYDYATVEVFSVNWMDLTQGSIPLRSGILGEVIVNATGTFQAELRGLTQYLTTQFGDVYQPTCRADLGDSKCQYNLSAATHSATVTGVNSYKSFTSTPLQYNPFSWTNTASITVSTAIASGNNSNAGMGVQIVINGVSHIITIGPYDAASNVVNNLTIAINAANIGVSASQTFTSNGSNSQTAGVDSIYLTLNDPTAVAAVYRYNDAHNFLTIQSFAESYFAGGLVTWTSGNNAGVSMEIKDYAQNTETTTLFLNMKFPIQVGDTFTYSPGCDKRRETCYFKFGNIINFRGEPDVPGVNATMSYPEATANGAFL